MYEWQVKLCDPLVTHTGHTSEHLETGHNKALYKFTCFTFLYCTVTAVTVQKCYFGKYETENVKADCSLFSGVLVLVSLGSHFSEKLNC